VAHNTPFHTDIIVFLFKESVLTTVLNVELVIIKIEKFVLLHRFIVISAYTILILLPVQYKLITSASSALYMGKYNRVS